MAAAGGGSGGTTYSLQECGPLFGATLFEMLSVHDISNLASCSGQLAAFASRCCELAMPDAVQQQEAQLRQIAAHPLGVPLDDFSIYRAYVQSLVVLPLGTHGARDAWLRRLSQARAPRPRRDAYIDGTALPPAEAATKVKLPPPKPKDDYKTIPARAPSPDPASAAAAAAGMSEAELAMLLEGEGEIQSMQHSFLNIHVPDLTEVPGGALQRCVAQLETPTREPMVAPRPAADGDSSANSVASVFDWGYAGQPPEKGWCNAFDTRGGAANDFIRLVGDHPNRFLAVVPAGSNVDATQYVRWDVEAHPLQAANMQQEARHSIQRDRNTPYTRVSQTWRAAAAQLEQWEAKQNSKSAV